ncbi:hypothetical protein GCM10023107_74130 [Actinoplanes octamycinicus]|nr:hypothetical protein Aoc01nite_54170 [Actinoplanes octamycinicus]
MPPPTDDHEAGGELVGDGPCEEITAREDAAAEEDGDIHVTHLVTAQRADVTLSAEVHQSVEVSGDHGFEDRFRPPWHAGAFW